MRAAATGLFIEIAEQPHAKAARRLRLAVGLGLLALGGCADLGQSLGLAAGGGRVLTDTNGMTLYVYDEDGARRSRCSGACAAAWPPLHAARDAQPHGHLTIFRRADGSRQWAYRGRPLYTSARDKKPGDRNGKGIDADWHLARS